MEKPGISETVLHTIQSLGLYMRPEMYKNIVLSGRTTTLPGLQSRLEAEIKALYLKRVLKGNTNRLASNNIYVKDQPYRMHAAFIGGSMLAYDAKDRAEFWILRHDYEEKG